MKNLDNKLLDIENIKNKFTKMGFGEKIIYFLFFHNTIMLLGAKA